MLLPLSLMAMTPISDKDMSKVTGQAGVSMTFDLTLNMSFGQLGWGDADGAMINAPAFGADTTNIAGGWIGIDNLQISTLHIWPRTDYTMEHAGGITASTVDGNYDGGYESLKWLTIDVVTLNSGMGAAVASSLFEYTALTNVTAVRIGVPTLTFTMAEMSGNVVLGPRAAGGSVGGIVDGQYWAAKDTQKPNFDQLMGKFYLAGLNMATEGGEVLIAAHGHATTTNAEGGALYGSGVTFILTDVKVSYLLLDVAAWGDIDGAFDEDGEDTAYNTGGLVGGTVANGLMSAGWVGIKDLAIQNIVINGVVTIDVGTWTDNTMRPDDIGSPIPNGTLNFESLVPTFASVFAYKNAQGGQDNYVGESFIFIGLNSVVVTMDKMYGQVALFTDVTGKPNTGAPQTLGDIYVGGMSMAIEQNPLTHTNSWFAIFAH